MATDEIARGMAASMPNLLPALAARGAPFTLAPDASAAVNDAAIVAAMATGRQVVLSGGEFATSGLSFTSSVRLRMEGGAKFRRTDQTKPALEIKLPWGAILNVSSITQETVVIPPYAGNQTVDVLTFTGLGAGALAAAGLTANKFARIVSNDYIPWGTGPHDSERLGESARIFDIVDTAGSNKVRFFRRLFVGQFMTTGIRVAAHNDAVVELVDVEVNDTSDGDTTQAAAAVSIVGAVRPIVRGARCFYSKSLFMNVQSCVEPDIEVQDVHNLTTTVNPGTGNLYNVGYGIQNRGSCFGRFEVRRASHLRHATTTSTSSVTDANLATAPFESWGGAIANHYLIHAFESGSAASDLHADSYKDVLEFVSMGGQYRDESSLAQFLNLRGEDWTVKGFGRGVRGIQVQFYGTASRGRIDGVTIDRVSGTDIEPVISMAGRVEFVGSISGTTLTVTSLTTPYAVLTYGLKITGSGVTTCWIKRQITGTDGGPGTYEVDISQTVAGGTAFVTEGDPQVQIAAKITADQVNTAYVVLAQGVRVTQGVIEFEGKLVGSSTGLLRSDSECDFDRFDARILSTSTAASPRVIRNDSVAKRIIIRKAKVIDPSGMTWVVRDHQSKQNAIYLHDIDMAISGTLAGSGSGNSGYTAGATGWANTRLNGGAGTPQVNRLVYAFGAVVGANRALDATQARGRGEPVVIFDITSTPTSGNDAVTTMPADGPDGQIVLIQNNPSSTATITLGTSITGVTGISVAINLAVGAVAKFIRSGGSLRYMA